MQISLEGSRDDWFEVEIGVAPSEVDGLIDLLRMIKDEPNQHFHLSADGSTSGGPGRITFCAMPEEEAGNAVMLSRAFLPGETIPTGE